MMASKTEMFRLLRLLDIGAGPEVGQAAAECWAALPPETRFAMVANGGADGRRARIWAAGWTNGIKQERLAIARRHDASV